VIEIIEMITLTHPLLLLLLLLQFCVVGGQELHEEFVLDWIQVFCEIVNKNKGSTNVLQNDYRVRF
jgi:hypothetical protein